MEGWKRPATGAVIAMTPGAGKDQRAFGRFPKGRRGASRSEKTEQHPKTGANRRRR